MSKENSSKSVLNYENPEKTRHLYLRGLFFFKKGLDRRPLKLTLIIACMWLFFYSVTSNNLISSALGYGYDCGKNGYGYCAKINDVDIHFSGSKGKIKKTGSDRAELIFDDLGDVTHYQISKDKTFGGKEWKSIKKNIKLKISTDNDYRKFTFYIRLKDKNGTLSKIYVKRLQYIPERSRSIKSKKEIVGDKVVILHGKKFSKSSIVSLYFSDIKGKFGLPIKVMTDKFGNLRYEYRINKTKGAYSWYAVNEKTGKKSNIIYYEVK